MQRDERCGRGARDDPSPKRVGMNSLVFLIPLSILLLVGAGVALFWAVDHGQFDDMETPALLPLLDADRAPTDVAPRRSAAADAKDAAETLP